jgi:polysaccharide lyase-like protein
MASWSGQFTGYAGPAWQRAWGYTPQSSWGQAQLTAVADPSAPGGGLALQVAYGKGSSANSCADCPGPGGGQFYTSFASAGQPALAAASVLYLRYYVKFPAGFDFGRGGKLPGLYGGPPGQESGGHHGQAFSTRYMWRDHPVAGSLGTCSSAVACAEVYLYTPQLSAGYGRDIGGTWNWQGDGRWHMIEQRVDRARGDIMVWYDGALVMSASGVLGGAAGIPFSGVLFSTFFGGHDTSWGPSVNEYAYFADFAVSTSPIGP